MTRKAERNRRSIKGGGEMETPNQFSFIQEGGTEEGHKPTGKGGRIASGVQSTKEITAETAPAEKGGFVLPLWY